jgi:ATP-dependent protease ClpP protease subunit
LENKNVSNGSTPPSPPPTPLLAQSYPGGCYLGFNAAIDRKAAEQVSYIVNDARLKGFTEVTLCMSSIGGLLDQTYYLFNIIEALEVDIVTWNIGNIQSAANMIFLCGDKRYASPGATFFFHQTGYDPPSSRVTEPYLAEKLKAVQYDDNRSASIIAAKTGKPIEDVRGWQNTELVMDTGAALAHGLIHDIRDFVIPPNAFFHQILI